MAALIVFHLVAPAVAWWDSHCLCVLLTLQASPPPRPSPSPSPAPTRKCLRAALVSVSVTPATACPLDDSVGVPCACVGVSMAMGWVCQMQGVAAGAGEQ